MNPQITWLEVVEWYLCYAKKNGLVQKKKTERSKGSIAWRDLYQRFHSKMLAFAPEMQVVFGRQLMRL